MHRSILAILVVSIFYSCGTFEETGVFDIPSPVHLNESTIMEFKIDNKIILENKSFELFLSPTSDFSPNFYPVNIRLFDFNLENLKWRNLFDNDILIVDIFKYLSSSQEYYLIISVENDTDNDGIFNGYRDELVIYLYFPKNEELKKINLKNISIAPYYIYSDNIEVIYKRQIEAYQPLYCHEKHIIFPIWKDKDFQTEMMIYSFEDETLKNGDAFLERHHAADTLVGQSLIQISEQNKDNTQK